MPPDALFFQFFAFLLGAIIGSFLNVVIYRLPLGMSIHEPRRSFCPQCKSPIPWRQNLPLVSWLLLRGKCARCGVRIPLRYFVVELLTALLFLLIWRHVTGASVPLPLAAQTESAEEPARVFLAQLAAAGLAALPLWVFAALLVASTWIDLDHLIIPDELTLGGTAAGLALSLLAPGLMGESSRWMALFWSAIGAASGYLLVWGVVEAGKLAFGRKRHRFEPPVPFRWRPRQGPPAENEGGLFDAELLIGEAGTPGGETLPWGEVFSRESDQLILETETLEEDGQAMAGPDAEAFKKALAQAGSGPGITLRFFHDRLIVQGGGKNNPPPAQAHEIKLAALPALRGSLRGIVIPREAMGFGDVKFMACIGAFLGWKGALFSLGAGSAIGAVAGVGLMLAHRREASGRIPFGPYLALGAMLWIFAGPELVAWYLGTLAVP